MTTRWSVLVLVAAAALPSPASARDAGCAGRHWVGAWAAPPSDGTGRFVDQTVRAVLTPLRGGTETRLRLSNRFGTRRVVFADVRLARQRRGAAIVAGSNRRITFAGRRRVAVAAGRDVLSDPVPFAVRAFGPLTVSMHVRGRVPQATQHFDALQRSYATRAGAGDHAADGDGRAFVEPVRGPYGIYMRPFVTELRVGAPKDTGVIAAVGDSLTDGGALGRDGDGIARHTGYPDFLARRLAGRPFSVVNLGIGGNRIYRGPLVPVFGPSLLDRLRPDLLSRPDVTDVILMQGINDLALPPTRDRPDGPRGTSEAVIAALERVVDRIRAARPGVRVLVGTLTPTGGAPSGHGSAATARKRRAVNRFIRTSGLGDGVVDFDRAVRDPARPGRIRPRFTIGDYLHLSSAGYRAMAEAVDLRLLRGPKCG